MSFYDQYLKGIEPSVEYPAYAVQDSAGTWRAQDTWPVVERSATVRFGGGSLSPVVFTPVYHAVEAGAFLLAAAVVAVATPLALPRAGGPDQGPRTASSARA